MARTGFVGQWFSVCLACLRPWVQSKVVPKKLEEKVLEINERQRQVTSVSLKFPS